MLLHKKSSIQVYTSTLTKCIHLFFMSHLRFYFAARSQTSNKLKPKLMEQEYLTVKEAADFLKLSVSYLYKLMMWKKVPYYKPFGNRCYFKLIELEGLIEMKPIK